MCEVASHDVCAGVVVGEVRNGGGDSGFFFQAEDGIRDLVRSRGLGDVYKRQGRTRRTTEEEGHQHRRHGDDVHELRQVEEGEAHTLSLIHI